MKGYLQLRKFLLKGLEEKLDENLTYHGIHHTLDVLKVVNEYIRRLKIKGEDAQLLRIGALIHDFGFTETYSNHEEKGCEIADELMPKYGFTQSQIKRVKGMIMATKVPQSPKNEFEKIICDADLDYLGRWDFDPISTSLFEEFKCYGIVQTEKEWNQLQVKFLEGHTYHTTFARKNRQPVKEKRIAAIKRLLA